MARPRSCPHPPCRSPGERQNMQGPDRRAMTYTMNLTSAAGSLPPVRALDWAASTGHCCWVTQLVDGDGFERNEGEVTVPRSWRGGKTVTSVRDVPPCASLETSRLFVSSIVGLGTRPPSCVLADGDAARWLAEGVRSRTWACSLQDIHVRYPRSCNPVVAV